MDRAEIAVEEIEPKAITLEGLRDLHGLMAAETLEARPHDPPQPLELLSALIGALPDHLDVRYLLARNDSGQAIGYALLNHNQARPSPHIVDGQIFAEPSHRRRGTAAALLQAVCSACEARGHTLIRTTTTGGIGWGEDLCRVLGGAPALERRTWRLPLAGADQERIRLVAAQAAERARGYSVEEVAGRVPDDIVDDAVELLQFLTEEQEGDLEPSDSRVTVPILRQLENTWKAIGQQRRWMFVRHDASGAIAGAVAGTWQPATPDLITQNHTIVRPEFRGRSLALWMKAAMIDKLLDEWTEAREIRTTSTVPNAAMDSVDERLGFLPYVRHTVWHIELQAVKDWLSAGPR